MKKRDAWLWSREQVWLYKNVNIIFLANQKIIQNYRINSDSWCQRNWLKGITHILVTGWETIRFQLKGGSVKRFLKMADRWYFSLRNLSSYLLWFCIIYVRGRMLISWARSICNSLPRCSCFNAHTGRRTIFFNRTPPTKNKDFNFRKFTRKQWHISSRYISKWFFKRGLSFRGKLSL